MLLKFFCYVQLTHYVLKYFGSNGSMYIFAVFYFISSLLTVGITYFCLINILCQRWMFKIWDKVIKVTSKKLKFSFIITINFFIVVTCFSGHEIFYNDFFLYSIVNTKKSYIIWYINFKIMLGAIMHKKTEKIAYLKFFF